MAYLTAASQLGAIHHGEVDATHSATHTPCNTHTQTYICVYQLSVSLLLLHAKLDLITRFVFESGEDS